jgi:hypothetical protein
MLLEMQSRRQICYSGDEDAEQSTTKARYHYTRRFKFSVLDAPISIQRKQTKKTTKKKKKNNQTATQNSHQKITTTCSHNNRSLPHLGAILSQDQCYKKAGTEKETENRWRSKHQARYRLPRVQKKRD